VSKFGGRVLEPCRLSEGKAILTSINQSDFAVIQMLLRDGALTINEMVERLGVTATAVRQRLSRLQESGLIQRSAVVDGRGRPSHRYELTEAGRRTVGNNLADLACALWAEIHEIEDAEIRRRVVSGAVRRLAEGYAFQVTGDTITDRLKSAAKLFADRDIPIALETEDQRFRAIVKLERKLCDLMVSNGPSAIDAARNEVELLDPDGKVLASIEGTKEEVAREIMRQIDARLVL